MKLIKWYLIDAIVHRQKIGKKRYNNGTATKLSMNKNEANFNDFLLQLTVPSKRMHNGSQTVIFFVEMKRKRLNLLLMCIVITVVIQGL